MNLLMIIQKSKKNDPLAFALGKDKSANPVYCCIDKMPNLLIASATGSGRSMCLHSLIMSILMRAAPDEVKLLLFDTKKIEFSAYQNIPHLIGSVINETEQAAQALRIISDIVDDRYDVFVKRQVRNIQSFNQMIEGISEEPKPKKLPYIVVIIDEMTGIMSYDNTLLWSSLQHITQFGRKTGIYLVISTQRPSIDIIPGNIKVNIPGRISFMMPSASDSRVILDEPGAEYLISDGDMLYLPPNSKSPLHVQGTYVSDIEINRVTSFVASEATPVFDDAFLKPANEGGIIAASDDPLFGSGEKGQMAHSARR